MKQSEVTSSRSLKWEDSHVIMRPYDFLCFHQSSTINGSEHWDYSSLRAIEILWWDHFFTWVTLLWMKTWRTQWKTWLVWVCTITHCKRINYGGQNMRRGKRGLLYTLRHRHLLHHDISLDLRPCIIRAVTTVDFINTYVAIELLKLGLVEGWEMDSIDYFIHSFRSSRIRHDNRRIRYPNDLIRWVPVCSRRGYHSAVHSFWEPVFKQLKQLKLLFNWWVDLQANFSSVTLYKLCVNTLVDKSADKNELPW